MKNEIVSSFGWLKPIKQVESSTVQPKRRQIAIGPRYLSYVCFAITAYYGIFRLPYHFPPTERLVSDSYVFGFNNAVAMITIVVLLGAATLMRFLYLRQQHHTDVILPYVDVTDNTKRISSSTFGLLALMYLLFTAAIYWFTRGVSSYSIDWESSHFLWNLKLMEIYGLRPYVDFKFDYGPALIYLPAYFQRLLSAWSISPEVSYYTFHYFVSLLGLNCLFFLLNRSRMPFTHKTVVFSILGIACLLPYMGLNGVAARFLIPYVSLVIVHETARQAQNSTSRLQLIKALFCVFVATVINISVSADIGLAFSAALVTYMAVLLRTDWRKLIMWLFAFGLGLMLSGIMLPAAYFESLFSFWKGANNFPLLPAAHLWLYILVLFVTVPQLILAGILGKQSSAPLAFGLGVLSVALIPGAFGRCDPPHVFFYGLGISLVMFIQMSQASKKWFLTYAAAYICVSIIGLQWSNARWFGVSYKVLAARFGFGERETNNLKNSRLRAHDAAASPSLHLAALDKYPQLGLPFGNYGTDKITENYLWARKKIRPDYFVGAVGIYTETDLLQKLQDISRNEFLLLSKGFWNFHESSDNCSVRQRYMQLLFIHPVTLPCKREGLDANLEVSKHISSLYQITESLGNNLILQRIN